MDLHFLRKRAFKEVKTIALAVFMLISLPVLLLICLLAVGFSVQFYRDVSDHFFCEDSRRIQSDEAAIALVQNSLDVKLFLKKYPDVSASNDYISKSRNRNIQYDKSTGFWDVYREFKYAFDEVVWVVFLYNFANPRQRSLDITCSMRVCNPRPDCIMDGPRD